MMNRFVVLDVETTGVAFSRGDRIIQIAYSVVEDGRITDRFASYINPERPIPPFIRSLTHINDEHVKDAPLFEEIAPKLLEELENAYFVAHNVTFDLSFINEELTHAGYVTFEGPVLDTVELSRIAFPTEDSFQLSLLTERLNVNHEAPHRADSDAEATAHLLMEIFNTFKTLPLLTLQQLEKLQGKLISDLGSLTASWMAEKTMKPEDDQIDAFRGLALKKTEPANEKRNRRMEDVPDLNDILDTTLNNEAAMKKIVSGYEHRSGQMEMIHFISDVFNENSIGLIEAGTGTGKTLGYLIPAAIEAKKTGEPVIISTETIQLQDQIIKKEIPALRRILPFPIQTALLKGRSHYLCLQKFENLLYNDPFDSYDRALSKAQILVWLTKTDTGDVEELTLASGSTRFWHEAASDAKSCAAPSCPWFSRCFYQRARKKSKQADIIITNHALLLTDVAADHQVIPSYSTLIIDEAHHLEDTATRQMGQKLDYLTVMQLLNDLTVHEDGGVMPKEAEQLLTGEARRKSKSAQKEANLFKQDWNDLFLQLNSYITSGLSGRNETGRLSKIIDNQDRQWKLVPETAERCAHRFRTVLTLLQEIAAEAEEPLNAKHSSTADDNGGLEWLESVTDQLEKQFLIFYHVILNQKDSDVYWLELETKGPKQSISVKGCPIDVSERLADDFFTKKERVILTSATLTVNNQFKYVIQRLGLDDFNVKTKQVGSPFLWKDQVSLMVPEDMPLIQEAGEEAYIEAAALQIYRIAHVTKGKMLVLFTSYDMLKRTYSHLKKMFDDSFMLIAQGIQTKSRSKLTKNFQKFDQAILLGTSSFWEGVDIPGSDLSCILMARLPFTPPNDPVFKKRSEALKEEGGSPFMKLALPQAVLRFKQGFGRLIRRSTDRGIVVVLDRRIVTTRYGKFFINSLPEEVPFVEEPMTDIEKRIQQWFSYDNAENVHKE